MQAWGKPGLNHPLGEGCICAWIGQETVRFKLAVVGWENMSGAEDGAGMGLAGYVSDGGGKGAGSLGPGNLCWRVPSWKFLPTGSCLAIPTSLIVGEPGL